MDRQSSSEKKIVLEESDSSSFSEEPEAERNKRSKDDYKEAGKTWVDEGGDIHIDAVKVGESSSKLDILKFQQIKQDEEKKRHRSMVIKLRNMQKDP